MVGHKPGQEDQIFELVPVSEGSAYQEYVLTEKGLGLFPLVVGLRQWGEAYFYQPGETHSVLVDRQHGAPVQPLQLRAADGRVLGPEDCVRVAGPSGGDAVAPSLASQLPQGHHRSGE